MNLCSDDGGVDLYLALDILYTQANAERYVNPRQIIRQICSQRRIQLQTKASSFCFICLTISQYFACFIN